MDTNNTVPRTTGSAGAADSVGGITGGVFKGDVGAPSDLTSTLPHTLTERGGLPRVGSRLTTLVAAAVALAVLVGIAVAAYLLPDTGLSTRLDARLIPPSWQHPFGTDTLGRDMLTRTIKGLSVSLRVGVISSVGAIFIAIVLGMLSALNKWLDMAIGVVIDLLMGLPHLVLLILISFAMGGGTKGVIVAVCLSHWPSPARLVRAEVRQVLAADYVQVSRLTCCRTSCRRHWWARC
jgi:peptide/nickel transport system permease protein